VSQARPLRSAGGEPAGHLSEPVINFIEGLDPKRQVALDNQIEQGNSVARPSLRILRAPRDSHLDRETPGSSRRGLDAAAVGAGD
jgi:hypothetical protein